MRFFMDRFLMWVFCASGLLITLRLIYTRGLIKGGRPPWIVVLLLVPSWMSFQLGGVRFDPRTFCAVAYLTGVLLQDYDQQWGGGWRLSDLFILLMVLAATISQFYWASVMPLAPFDQFRDMVFPYLVGRFFIRSARDIKSILPAFCICITLLALYAIVEATTKKNQMELALGRPWFVGEPAFDPNETDLRWGLKRAYGPQTHSIYFGLTFAMFLPWSIEAAVQSWQRRGPAWWKLVPFFTLAGVVCTGSRGAQICSLLVLGAIFFQAAPRLRPLLLILFAFGSIGFVAIREDVVRWLQHYADEGGSYDLIKINGVTYEYSGTKHRDLLFVVYEEAIEKAGWFGYGTLIKKVPVDPEMDKRFISIDNHYLMFYLQYGYLGLTAFALFALSVLWNLLPPMLNGTGPPGRLAGGLFGAIGGCLIVMRSVWFSPDYSWVWLFCTGLTVSLARLHRETE